MAEGGKPMARLSEEGLDPPFRTVRRCSGCVGKPIEARPHTIG